MSEELVPIRFPLAGSRLIEASAGTGKTWTIAALYVRLILGHGGPDAFCRPLLPSEILVMTFTRAATKELSDRIRQRLLEAAACFQRPDNANGDAFLKELCDGYDDPVDRSRAAHRLALAAETMDEAAVFTIDAWCQRMLREHAFESGCLFDEELISSEETIFRDAVRDYWRQHVYALDIDSLTRLRGWWPDLHVLERAIRPLVQRAWLLDAPAEPSLAVLFPRLQGEQLANVARLKQGWSERADRMEAWIEKNRKALDGNKLRANTVAGYFAAIRAWVADPGAVEPEGGYALGRTKLTPEFLLSVRKDPAVVPPDDFLEVDRLDQALQLLESMEHACARHAAVAIAARIAEIKQRRGQFGFADMLVRLRRALESANGDTLRARITARFPVALIDEFQDTSPDQYRIFDLLYRIAESDTSTGLFLIGDPKQAIYGFRGADIHSYLAARRATEGRHYRLATNYRSTGAVVNAVNHLFLHAEGCEGKTGHDSGAFRFRKGDANPLPFDTVKANGRKELLVGTEGHCPALTLWCASRGNFDADEYRAHFAGICAEAIVGMLNDRSVGFQEEEGFVRLRPADIAVLVRNKREAAAVRDALVRRGVASVYLSDKDSVFHCEEAADVLRWLRAVASPLDGTLARAAFATRTAGLTLSALAPLATDDLAWEARADQLKALRAVWQRQGVLAMLRRFIHELDLPAALFREPGGERRLTNLLHLAEMLQSASRQLDGEQALIRWLAEQIENDTEGEDERILRLESDAQLVKVVTVHKSKGLEYPLVFLPFAVSARKIDGRNRQFCEFADSDGKRRIQLKLTGEALAAMDAARMDEDLRLLYVALTRARHALWIGVASLKDKIHDCAFGHLLAGGTPVTCADLAQMLHAMCGECADIRIEPADASPGTTMLARGDEARPLCEPAAYDTPFERDWGISSYTSITRSLSHSSAAPPVTPMEEKLIDEDTFTHGPGPGSQPWHRFPRGAIPGQFLHGQLEWMAGEGFAMAGATDFDSRLGARCNQLGWERHRGDVVAWLRAVATASLPPIGCALVELQSLWPEMEFWIPAEHADIAELDQICQARLLDGLPRPRLQTRDMHGMLRGFQDLVFERNGRYWVLDYKSNSLGKDDAGYDSRSLMTGMAEHRYDVQGTIYLLALHRLLRSRLGSTYDPSSQLGGAVFFFLRGIGNRETHGCFHLHPDMDLLERVDRLLSASSLTEATA